MKTHTLGNTTRFDSSALTVYASRFIVCEDNDTK